MLLTESLGFLQSHDHKGGKGGYGGHGLLRELPASASGSHGRGSPAAPAAVHARCGRRGVSMIKIGIVGYGNLAKGVECAIRQNPDMTLCAVFTRRDPKTVQIKTENVPVLSVDQADAWVDKIDVMILCGGSATDLPVMTPAMAAKFNVVDSFDTHARIPEHFASVDAAAKRGGNVAVTGCVNYAFCADKALSAFVLYGYTHNAPVFRNGIAYH